MQEPLKLQERKLWSLEVWSRTRRVMMNLKLWLIMGKLSSFPISHCSLMLRRDQLKEAQNLWLHLTMLTMVETFFACKTSYMHKDLASITTSKSLQVQWQHLQLPPKRPNWATTQRTPRIRTTTRKSCIATTWMTRSSQRSTRVFSPPVEPESSLSTSKTRECPSRFDSNWIQFNYCYLINHPHI